MSEQRSWREREKGYVAAGFLVGAIISVFSFALMLFLRPPTRGDYAFGAIFGTVISVTLNAILISQR